MTQVAETLMCELAQLSAQDRAELAARLIDSLENPEADAAWKSELLRRQDEIQSGRAKGEPAADVFARARGRLS